MIGAGTIAAFDSHTENATNKGHLGGLLQALSYMAGLSGGRWLGETLYIDNFTSIEAIITMHKSVFVSCRKALGMFAGCGLLPTCLWESFCLHFL